MTRKKPVVFGICGESNSGKTWLIEKLIPRLHARGLRVGVIKHCGSHFKTDQPGKDTDRIFRAGGDVLAQGPEEWFMRLHCDEKDMDVALERMGRIYDLVLVECRSDVPIPQVQLGNEKKCVAAKTEAQIMTVIEQAHAAIPLCAAILVGGESSRMGRSKSLLQVKGRFVLEQIVAQAGAVADRVVLVGGGEIPASLSSVPRLPDAPDMDGPVAGMLSAFRWQPEARWIILACDLPLVSREALAWLAGRSAPGIDAVLPHVDDPNLQEPLFALYEPAVGVFLERGACAGRRAIHRAIEGARIVSPEIPAHLRPAWTNTNTPAELRRVDVL